MVFFPLLLLHCDDDDDAGSYVHNFGLMRYNDTILHPDEEANKLALNGSTIKLISHTR